MESPRLSHLIERRSIFRGLPYINYTANQHASLYADEWLNLILSNGAKKLDSA